MELEADKYFLAAYNQEISVREKTLMEKLDTLEQNASDRAKEVKGQKWKSEYRLKHQVLKAFEWDEATANPVFLRAVCAFWAALSVPQLADDGSNRKQRISQRDRFQIWKELTLDGWGGKMRIELEREFVKSKKFCPILLAKASDVDSRFNVSAASAITVTRKGKNTIEGLFQAIKRVVALCSVYIMLRSRMDFRRTRCTKMAIYGAGAMKMGASRTG